MSIVAGVDFGTLSVRVSIFDSERGRLGSGTGGLSAAPHARPTRNHATQSHHDHMTALETAAMAQALRSANIAGIAN